MLPKEFIIEDGQIYYRKKPLHKQALFWTTIVGGVLTVVLGLACIFLFLAFIGTETYEEISKNGYGYESFDTFDGPTDLSAYQEFSIGEKVSLEGDVDLTVQSMQLDPAVKLFDDTYQDALVVKLLVENNSADEDFYFDEYYFSLTDRLGISHYYLDMRTYDVNVIEKVSSGSKEEVVLVFAVDEEAGYALTYDEAVWYSHSGSSI